MNRIFLQSLMETQKSVSEVGAKTDRLITDVAKQNEKLDTVRVQISFVKGATWAVFGLLATAIAISTAFGVAAYNKAAPTATGQSNSQTPAPSAPARR